MSSKKSEIRVAREEMIRQAELPKQAKENTPMRRLSRFFGWAVPVVIVGGLFISVICAFVIYNFDLCSAWLCTAYAAAICADIWIVLAAFADTESESAEVKRAKLLRDAKEEEAVSGVLKGTFGGLIVTFIGVAHLCFAIFTDSLKISAQHLGGLACLLGTIFWGMLGLRVVCIGIGLLFSYKRILAEEAAGATFIELPPDEDEEEIARLIVERRCGIVSTNDSHPNNMDAENDYIDDPDYERGQNRYNCHRSPATQRNSRQPDASSSDDSFYDEIQF